MRFFIETFGCQMNKNDSLMMEASLLSSGFAPAENQNDADIVIFNTCSVRDSAERRAKGRLKEAMAQVRERKGIVVAAGCMAQRIPEFLINGKYCSIAIGTYQSPSIGKIIENYLNGDKRRVFDSFDENDYAGRISGTTESWHKWITITHGCENFCTYCIVPYVRGKLISASSGEILSSIKSAVDNGAIEITLLGQNVNQYGQDNGEIPFYRLLDESAKIKGIERINFLTSHPKDFDTNIIEVIKNNQNISRSVHLPLQSGSDSILKQMNRIYSFSDYMKIIDKIKELPDFSITTDLIVGFPGETNEDFEETIKAVRLVQYDEAFMYAYSPRESTPAASFKNHLDKKIKSERLKLLIETQREISALKLKARIGRTESVIIEGISRKNENEVYGKSFLAHPVITSGNSSDTGKLLNVKIDSVKGSALIGSRSL